MKANRLPLDWKLANGKFSCKTNGNEYLSIQNLSGSVFCDDELFCLPDAEQLPAAAISDADVHEEFLFKNGIRWIQQAKGDGQSVILNVTLRNDSDKPVKIGICNLLHGRLENGFNIELGSNPNRFLQFCWVPWNTTIRHIKEEKGEYGLSHQHRTNETHSFTLCHLSDMENKNTLLLSFITLNRMKTLHTFTWNDEKNCVGEYSASCHSNRLLRPGEELTMETLRVEYFNDPQKALEFWADDVNQRYKPDFSGTQNVVIRGGWDSHVWEDRFKELMDFCDTQMNGFDLKLISGNNHHTMKDNLPGHWLQFGTCKDGRSYEELYREAAKRGWRFKFWFSPCWFFGEAEETLEENKDNLFKNPQGDIHTWDWPGGWELSTKYASDTLKQYFLDGTHPKTAEYLKKVFSYYRELGVRMCMMDFLNPACGPGCVDDTQQPIEVLTKLFTAIREAAGKDFHIQTAVGSGPNYIGLTNSGRVSRDFGEGRPQYPFSNWQNATYCMHDRHFSNIDSFMQNASAVWFTNYKIYVNDLNNLTIDKPVPLEFARMTTTMFGLSGDSPVMLADYLPGMDPERLRMVKSILPRTRGIPVPVDLFDRPTTDGGCHILKKTVNTPWDNYMLVMVFNSQPDSPDFKTEVDFARLGLSSSKSYRVFEFWNGEYIGTFRKSFDVTMPSGVCRLYRISESRPHPWILGTDMHIEQGNVELKNVCWNSETLTLSGTAVRPQGECGRIYFTIPRHLYLADCTHIMTMKEVVDMQTIATLPVYFNNSDQVEFTLKFKIKDNDIIAHHGWFDFTTESGWLEYLKEHPLPGNRVID